MKMAKLTIKEYSVLKAADEQPELHFDLLEEPKEEESVETARKLEAKGYLKDLGGISQEEYSFKITKAGKKCLEENEREALAIA